MNKSFALMGTTLLAFALSQGALGDNVYEWEGDVNGNWSTAGNWDENLVPNSVDHKVVIDPGSADTVLMDGDYTVGELIVGQLATLNIQGGNTLTLDRGTSSPTQNGRLTVEATSSSVFGVINIRDNGTFVFANHDGTNHHLIGGKMVLQGAGSDLKVTASNPTFNPYFDGSSFWTGLIVGENSSAQFLIDGGRTVNSDITFAGRMTIQEGTAGTDPVFNNSHKVIADVVGTLTFEADVTLDDDSLATWYAWSSSSAVLLFKKDATSLAGDFLLDDCATIKLAEGVDITTGGDLLDGPGTGSYDGYMDTCGTSGGADDTCFDAANISPICDDIAEGASCSAASCP